MRCLYCGKELALFKRLRGGEFCSDAHRQKYQEEYTQLALNRLLQANAPKENENGEKDAEDGRLREADSPALKRRERLGREEVRPAFSPAERASGPEPVNTASAPLAETPASSAASIAAPKTAVLEPEPAPAPDFTPASEVAAPPHPAPVEEPAPAPMASFLVECPLPPEFDAPAPLDSSAPLVLAGAPALPRSQPFQPDLDAARLDPAGRVTLSLFTAPDFQTPPRERGLELREFVRGIPQVEIQVKPAVESGFEPVKEPFEVILASYAPDGPPAVWLAPDVDLAVADAAIALGDLARLDFALTDWGGEGAEQIRAEAPPSQQSERQPSEPAPSQEPPEMAVRLEPMRLEPAQHEPAAPASSRPEPLHFEPVHIDPVFMEKIAGTAGIETPQAPEQVEQRLAEPVEEHAAVVAQEPVAEAPEASVTELVVEHVAEPVAEGSEPVPAGITRPLPVTLHGLAPMRGKPVQVFTSAVLRAGELQIPRETGLPLRPVMILGPVPKPAAEPVAAQPSAPAAKPVSVPSKSESPKPEAKPRKAEVRVLPVQVKEIKPEQAKPASVKPEPVKPVAVKPEPVKPEPREAPKAKESPAATPSAKFEPAKTEPVKTEPAKADAKPAAAKATETPRPLSSAQELDSLGLPKLAFQQQEGFWSKLPAVAKLAVIAGVLALVVGGVVLTSRGSGSNKPAVVSSEPEMVAEPDMGNTAGWEQDWFADRAGAKPGRHVDVLRGSLGLRDYRLLFEGQIEHGAIGWVFRADNKSFYVEKIQVVTPGHDPVVALERFAVINGVEQQRTQVALPIQAHLDTMYKVRMDAVGDRFTTWVQDQKVDQWTDSQIPVGGAGLYYDAGDSFKLRDTLNVLPLRKK